MLTVAVTSPAVELSRKEGVGQEGPAWPSSQTMPARLYSLPEALPWYAPWHALSAEPYPRLYSAQAPLMADSNPFIQQFLPVT